MGSYLSNESTDELARQVRQILYHQLKGPESETNRIKTGNENHKRFRRCKGKEGKENLRFFPRVNVKQIICVSHRREDETK